MRKVKHFWDALRAAWRDSSFRYWSVIVIFLMGMGWAIRLSFGQMVALGSFACIGLTWEMANTSIESLMNILHPSFSPKVKVVKDAFGAAPVIAFSVFLVLFVVFLGTKVMG